MYLTSSDYITYKYKTSKHCYPLVSRNITVAVWWVSTVTCIHSSETQNHSYGCWWFAGSEGSWAVHSLPFSPSLLLLLSVMKHWPLLQTSVT